LEDSNINIDQILMFNLNTVYEGVLALNVLGKTTHLMADTIPDIEVSNRRRPGNINAWRGTSSLNGSIIIS
jgi:hypothetical protein